MRRASHREIPRSRPYCVSPAIEARALPISSYSASNSARRMFGLYGAPPARLPQPGRARRIGAQPLTTGPSARPNKSQIPTIP